MSACKLSLFISLFIGLLFVSGYSFKYRTEDKSLELGATTSCTLSAISTQLNLMLNDAGVPIIDLSYNDTLELVKNITRLYFTSGCKIPSFSDAYANVSNLVYSQTVSDSIGDGIVTENTRLNQFISVHGSIPYDQLLLSINRIKAWSRRTFNFAYYFAPVQWLVCNQILALSVLATKSPGTNATATELLKTVNDTCSSQLNRVEYDMTQALLNVDFTVERYKHRDFTNVRVEYFGDDIFLYKVFCAPWFCLKSCSKDDLFYNWVSNPFTRTYSKVFNAGYCKMRNSFSLFDTSYNIVAVKCLDGNLYFARDFVTGVWQSTFGEGGKPNVKYDTAEYTLNGIYLQDKTENLFLDFQNGKVMIENVVMCEYVQFLNRCDVGVPRCRGSCYL